MKKGQFVAPWWYVQSTSEEGDANMTIVPDKKYTFPVMTNMKPLAVETTLKIYVPSIKTSPAELEVVHDPSLPSPKKLRTSQGHVTSTPKLAPACSSHSATSVSTLV